MTTPRRWPGGLSVVLLPALIAGAACASGPKQPATGQLRLKFDVDKPCIHVGEKQKLVTRTVQGANIAYAILYADEKLRGDPPKGDTNRDGKFSASWVVPGDAPVGAAHVRILAVHGARTGSIVVPFKIVAAGTKCS